MNKASERVSERERARNVWRGGEKESENKTAKPRTT